MTAHNEPFFYLLSAKSRERICPPSSRVSPICYPQNPSGGELDAIDFVAIAIPSLCSLRRAHIKRRRLIMPLVALVQKKSQRTRNFVLSSGAWHSLRSSPQLLQFRLRRSECLYKRTLSFEKCKNSVLTYAYARDII